MSATMEILVILVCLLGTGLFAGLETGVISIHRLRLRHMVRKNIRGAQTLQHFLDHPDHLLGTTLVGTNICMVTASVTTASLSARYLGPWGTTAASVFMALVILILCEYIPKAWFQSRPARRTRPFAGFLKASGWLLHPASRVVMFLARLLVPAPSPEVKDREPFITKEELKHLTHEGEASGELTTHERKMITAVLELAHRSCRQIMVPRARMILVHDDTPRDEILAVARERGRLRLPVYADDEKRFIGIVHVFDVLRDTSPGEKRARDYMRPPQFVAGDTPADELLPRMRLSRQPMALVTNRRSQVIGLVTSDMVLQEIVG